MLLREYKQVIYIYTYKIQALQHLVHEALKHLCCIIKAKGHFEEFKQSKRHCGSFLHLGQLKFDGMPGQDLCVRRQ